MNNEYSVFGCADVCQYVFRQEFHIGTGSSCVPMLISLLISIAICSVSSLFAEREKELCICVDCESDAGVLSQQLILCIYFFIFLFIVISPFLSLKLWRLFERSLTFDPATRETVYRCHSFSHLYLPFFLYQYKFVVAYFVWIEGDAGAQFIWIHTHTKRNRPLIRFCIINFRLKSDEFKGIKVEAKNEI